MNVHLYPSVLKNESRILKITRSLSKNKVFDEIEVIGRAGSDLPICEDKGEGIYFFRLAPIFGGGLSGTFGKVVLTLGWYLAVIMRMRGRRISCLNCHSLPVLPLAVILKLWKRCILIYDTHELETETNGLSAFRRKFAKCVERSLIRNVDAVCVVNQSIANWYQESYSLKHVWVVHNMPLRQVDRPKRTGLLRNAIGLNSPNTLLFIYQGILAQGRGIELLLEVFEGINDDKHLVFMGYGSLEKKVKNYAQLNSNIHFMPAVDPDVVKDFTVDADVGFSLMENNSLSNYLSAPNKLYEYTACGVASIVSNFPEMARFVDSTDCGWKTEPAATALRCLIDSIDLNILGIKRANAIFSSNKYSWEEEESELLQMYDELGFSCGASI